MPSRIIDCSSDRARAVGAVVEARLEGQAAGPQVGGRVGPVERLHPAPDLGRQDEAFAPADRARPVRRELAAAVAVEGRRIEVVDAGVERGGEGGGRLGLLDPPRKPPSGAEPKPSAVTLRAVRPSLRLRVGLKAHSPDLPAASGGKFLFKCSDELPAMRDLCQSRLHGPSEPAGRLREARISPGARGWHASPVKDDLELRP